MLLTRQKRLVHLALSFLTASLLTHCKQRRQGQLAQADDDKNLQLANAIAVINDTKDQYDPVENSFTGLTKDKTALKKQYIYNFQTPKFIDSYKSEFKNFPFVIQNNGQCQFQPYSVRVGLARLDQKIFTPAQPNAVHKNFTKPNFSESLGEERPLISCDSDTAKISEFLYYDLSTAQVMYPRVVRNFLALAQIGYYNQNPLESAYALPESFRATYKYPQEISGNRDSLISFGLAQQEVKESRFWGFSYLYALDNSTYLHSAKETPKKDDAKPSSFVPSGNQSNTVKRKVPQTYSFGDLVVPTWRRDITANTELLAGTLQMALWGFKSSTEEEQAAFSYVDGVPIRIARLDQSQSQMNILNQSVSKLPDNNKIAIADPSRDFFITCVEIVKRELTNLPILPGVVVANNPELGSDACGLNKK